MKDNNRQVEKNGWLKGPWVGIRKNTHHREGWSCWTQQDGRKAGGTRALMPSPALGSSAWRSMCARMTLLPMLAFPVSPYPESPGRQ